MDVLRGPGPCLSLAAASPVLIVPGVAPNCWPSPPSPIPGSVRKSVRGLARGDRLQVQKRLINGRQCVPGRLGWGPGCFEQLIRSLEQVAGG